jgi:hypothetical protein
VGGLLEGAPITREIPESPALDADPSPLARGGNTLVLKPALLAQIPNVAPCIGGRVCRRSDMLWARLAVALEGARFTRAPIPALHDRSGPGRSSFDFDKLLDDARGSAVVAALDALLAEGALEGRRPLTRSAVTRAGLIYVARHASASRLFSAPRSACEPCLIASSCGSAPLPEEQASIRRMERPSSSSSSTRRGSTSRTRRASIPVILPRQPEIERFFLDLPRRIEAYRAGAPGPLHPFDYL